MVSAVHHELDAFGNGAELPDNQSITDEIVEVRNMFLKLVRTVHVVIVSVVSDDDAWILYHILDKAEARDLRIRKDCVRIGSFGDIVHGGKSRFIGVKISQLAEKKKAYTPGGQEDWSRPMYAAPVYR
jgi:hypothetical protein